jgi:hypothetical protein
VQNQSGNIKLNDEAQNFVDMVNTHQIPGRSLSSLAFFWLPTRALFLKKIIEEKKDVNCLV